MNVQSHDLDTVLIRERLALGTWALGGPWGVPQPMGYGSVTEEMASKVFDAAWLHGIRWVDTAGSYGNGESWRRLAAWQARTGRRFRLVVKLGRPVIDGIPVPAIETAEVMSELEAAIALLGVPNVVLIKDPPGPFFADGLLTLLDRIRTTLPNVTVGVASHRMDKLCTLPNAPHLGIVQIEYNGVNWPVAAPSASKMKEKSWTVWAVQPLAYGFLGRQYDEHSCFPADDWRSKMSPETKRVLWELAHAFLSLFQEMRPQPPPAVCAIAFCLSDANIDRVVVGPKTPQQLQDSFSAVRLALDPCFKQIAGALRRVVLAEMAPRES
jgi:aryl-alcohol dehydrogenase-like predicted oxidoreductase